MKILHICSDYAYSTLYKNLINGLLKKDTDNVVLFPTASKKKNVQESNVLTCKIWTPIDRFFFHIKANKLVNLIKRLDNIDTFDLIHAHFLFSNGYAAYLINKKKGIPYVVSVRNTDMNVFFRYFFFLRKLGRKVLSNANAIILLSDSYKQQLLEKYVPEKMHDALEKKIYVIPNGIDSFWFDNYFSSFNAINLRKIKILFAGNIDKNKNLLKTAHALQILINKGYNIEYIIVGKIVNKKIFRKLCKKNFIDYRGEKNNIDLLKIYRECDVFVMPSRFETFGLVYAEALSQALPIIYTKGQGFDMQFYEGQVGYHVCSNDAIDIATKIEQAINNKKRLRVSKQVLKDRFDWNIICEKLKQIYCNTTSS